jgi:putative intracellular protease/amidase
VAQPAARIWAPSRPLHSGMVITPTSYGLTGFFLERPDIRNAGGDWVDEPVVICENGPNTLITSRKPADLPSFNADFTDRFAEAATSARS